MTTMEVGKEATIAINARDIAVLAGLLAAIEDDSELSREEMLACVGCLRRQITRNAAEITAAIEA
jgi:hypothetical protein